MTKLSDTISPQEYEKKRDRVIELMTKIKDEDALMSLSYLNDFLKLDENLPPAYVVGRMMNEGILDNEPPPRDQTQFDTTQEEPPSRMRINQKVIRENGEIFFFLIIDEVKNSRTTPAYFPLPTKA